MNKKYMCEIKDEKDGFVLVIHLKTSDSNEAEERAAELFKKVNGDRK